MDFCEVCGAERASDPHHPASSSSTPTKPTAKRNPARKPRPAPESEPTPPTPPSPPDSNGCGWLIAIILGCLFVIMVGRCMSFNAHPKKVSDKTLTIPLLGTCTYTGEVDKEGHPNGKGEAKFTDGRIYKGEFKQGNADGLDAYLDMLMVMYFAERLRQMNLNMGNMWKVSMDIIL